MKHSVPRRWESLTFSAFIGRSGSREVAEDKGRVIRGMPQAHTMRCWRISGCRYVMMTKHRVLPPHDGVQGGAQCVSDEIKRSRHQPQGARHGRHTRSHLYSLAHSPHACPA